MARTRGPRSKVTFLERNRGHACLRNATQLMNAEAEAVKTKQAVKAIEKRTKKPTQINMQKWRVLQATMEEVAKKEFEEAGFGSSFEDFYDYMESFFDDHKIPLPPSSDEEDEE